MGHEAGGPDQKNPPELSSYLLEVLADGCRIVARQDQDGSRIGRSQNDPSVNLGQIVSPLVQVADIPCDPTGDADDPHSRKNRQLSSSEDPTDDRQSRTMTR